MNQKQPARYWEITLAVLSIVVFVAASVSIVIMLGLLPSDDLEYLRTLTE